MNTGNSLDAVDVILTNFCTDGSIQDLDAISSPMPGDLVADLRLFRKAVTKAEGDMTEAAKIYASENKSMDQLINTYTLYVSQAINKLVQRQKPGVIFDIIGFHGQTCAHKPPSISKDPAYTIQIGDGQLLANETGIPVVYDFRSDDIMNGGEGAPLAPFHHEHLAIYLKNKGKFPVAFCNAGNTGNITLISQLADGNLITLGWDVGPFNEYPDKLMQSVRGLPCDFDGKVGALGKVNSDLLRLFFDKSAGTEAGGNFLLRPPPKSSDPQWYYLLPELIGETSTLPNSISFEDKVRTAEYFSAYIFFYSLKWIPAHISIPRCFALCGGGWNNPVTRLHFEQLLRGEFEHNLVLTEHQEIFVQIFKRLKSSGTTEVGLAEKFGFNSQYMEARIFADAAVCRLKGIPFTFPETTGCRTPTVLGIIRYPDKGPSKEKVKKWLLQHNSSDLTLDKPNVFDGRWSRAADGWQTVPVV